MATSVDEGYNQRILMAGDSRLKRLRNVPCKAIPLHSIDFIIVNGVTVQKLIELVDEQLTIEHATLVIVAFIGDVTCLVNHQLTENSTVALVSHQPGHPATGVLELAAAAHIRWQTSRADRKIIWTLPYYIDVVTYNRFRLQTSLSAEIMERSIETSQAFVHFVDQLLSKWKNIMPKGAFYSSLNDVLFHGKAGRDLQETFTFLGVHFVFPKDLLIDGLHPSPKFSDMLWVCLARATRRVITAPPNPVPTFAKLSVKSRLWHSTSDVSKNSQKGPQWKGKGKGKRSTPYPPTLRTHSSHTPSAPSGYLYQSTSQGQPAYHYNSQYIPAATRGPSCSTPYYPPPPKKVHPQEKLLEEKQDTYGNLSWHCLPAEPLNPVGMINYSCPQKWNWEIHTAGISRVQGRSITNSIARQNDFREQAANIVRERALEEMYKGLNSSTNMAASTLAHRQMYQFSQPPPDFQHTNEDLQNCMPPPNPQSYYYPPS